MKPTDLPVIATDRVPEHELIMHSGVDLIVYDMNTREMRRPQGTELERYRRWIVRDGK